MEQKPASMGQVSRQIIANCADEMKARMRDLDGWVDGDENSPEMEATILFMLLSGLMQRANDLGLPWEVIDRAGHLTYQASVSPLATNVKR